MRTAKAGRDELQAYPAKCKSILWTALFLILALARVEAQQPAQGANEDKTGALDTQIPSSDCGSEVTGSPYIPVDSWIYQAINRLYAMGYVTNTYLGLRPWTRTSVIHMLVHTDSEIQDAEMYGDPTFSEATEIYRAVRRELGLDSKDRCTTKTGQIQFESSYTTVRGITGTALHDSFHVGSSIIDDYGRPYSHGFNIYTGVSGYVLAGRFLLYVRGEFEGASSAAGYSPALTGQLAAIDLTKYYYAPSCWENLTGCTAIPNNQQSTIPMGPIPTTRRGRFLEAYVSAHYLNNVFSFGKQDYWQGPGLGGAMSYSNNAENIYSFQINRTEPLYVPLLSSITGPFRYQLIIGPLRGHTYPINPWVHIEKVSFRPTENVEFGFERTAIWGGKGHEPITIKSFARSFLSLTAPPNSQKNSSSDPGARFGAFDFSYRLPYLRNSVTLYCDSEVHDDVSPIDAPRNASWRPGIFLSHVPGVPKLDLRLEGVSTDPPTTRSNGGLYMYWETIQRNGYTNNGQVFGDWVGREGKGGQAWLTYHLSGNEWIQAGMRNQKVAKDFIPGGTTLNDINFQVVKRIHRDLELKGDFTFEHYKAPIYLPGEQTVTVTTFQLTWFPERKVSF
jgi:hypothetical protein